MQLDDYEIRIAYDEYNPKDYHDFELCFYELNMEYFAVTSGIIAKPDDVEKIELDPENSRLKIFVNRTTQDNIEFLLNQKLKYNFVLIKDKIIKGYCVPLYIERNMLPFKCPNFSELESDIDAATDSI